MRWTIFGRLDAMALEKEAHRQEVEQGKPEILRAGEMTLEHSPPPPWRSVRASERGRARRVARRLGLLSGPRNHAASGRSNPCLGRSQDLGRNDSGERAAEQALRLASADLDVVGKRRDETHDRKREVRNARLEGERHGRPVHLVEQIVGQPLGKVGAKPRGQLALGPLEVRRERCRGSAFVFAHEVGVEEPRRERAGDRLGPLEVVANGIARARAPPRPGRLARERHRAGGRRAQRGRDPGRLSSNRGAAGTGAAGIRRTTRPPPRPKAPP